MVMYALFIVNLLQIMRNLCLSRDGSPSEESQVRWIALRPNKYMRLARAYLCKTRQKLSRVRGKGRSPLRQKTVSII
jgi:hypothetical protein